MISRKIKIKSISLLNLLFNKIILYELKASVTNKLLLLRLKT